MIDENALLTSMVELVNACFALVIDPSDFVEGRIYEYHRPFSSVELKNRWLCVREPYYDKPGDLVVIMVNWPDLEKGVKFKLMDLGADPDYEVEERKNFMVRTIENVIEATIERAIKQMIWCGPGPNPFE